MAPVERHEHGAEHEQRDLGARGVDAGMARHGLVVADGAQREAEPRAADPEADGEHQDGERQKLPVDLRRRDVGEDVAAERARLVDLEPGDELADQLGQAEAEDHEVDAAQAQGREADDGRHDDADGGRDQQHQRPGQALDEDGRGVGADAEERHGRQRDVARGAGEQAPGRGQHRVAHDVDGERQAVVAQHQGHAGEHGDRDGGECDAEHLAAAHRLLRPRMPCGRTSSTSRKMA